MEQQQLFGQGPLPRRLILARASRDAGDLAWIGPLGYLHACWRPEAGFCGVRPLLFTGAIVVGITEDSYVGRYCYATVEEAVQALRAWDGGGDPPGLWIKYKSAAGERHGPGLVADAP